MQDYFFKDQQDSTDKKQTLTLLRNEKFAFHLNNVRRRRL